LSRNTRKQIDVHNRLRLVIRDTVVRVGYRLQNSFIRLLKKIYVFLRVDRECGH
jgi:hypothetical protein